MDAKKKKLQDDFFKAAGPNVRALAELFELSNDIGFYIKDVHGRIMAINRRNCEICNIRDAWDAIGLRSSDLFPKIKGELIEENSGVPEVLQFRNWYINVIVGVESNYELGFEMLKRYNEMGILSDEDLEYRTNSLRTHRLQKCFDGVYTYRPKDEDL